MKKILSISGMILLMLFVYSMLQSTLALACTLGGLAYGDWQGLVSGDVVKLFQTSDPASLPAAAKYFYYAGMSVGLCLSAVLMLVIIHYSGLFRMRLSLFRSISWKPLLLSTLLVFTTMWALNIFVQWFPLEDQMEDVFAGVSHNIIGALTISVIAPVLEEVMFRGAIQGYIIRKTGSPALAIITASLVFGIFHINPVQVVFATLLGLVLGWMYYRTGSLLSVIVGHVLNNSIATFMMLLAGNVAETEISEISGYSEQQMMIMTIVMFVFFVAISIYIGIALHRSLPSVPVPWHESDVKVLPPPPVVCCCGDVLASPPPVPPVPYADGCETVAATPSADDSVVGTETAGNDSAEAKE